jgi:hypothetical protein
VTGSIEIVRQLSIALLLVFVLGGCGGSGRSADETVTGLVEALSSSDYETAYDMLHSAHQKIVPEQLFVECGRKAEQISTPRVDSFDITGDVKRDRTIPELGDVEVVEVGVNLTQGTEVSPRVWNVIKDDGEWRWLMAEAQLNAFRAGSCPQ